MTSQLELLETVKHPVRRHTLKDARLYETNHGFFPSVTTILDKTMPDEERERLRKWRHKMAQVQKKKSESGSSPTSMSPTERGTKIHEMIQHTFLGGEPEPNPELADYWTQAKKALKSIEVAIAYEQSVYHPGLKYAGTFDLICKYRGKPTLVDWKTSHQSKKRAWLGNAFMQTASYARAYESLTRQRIDQTLVIVLSPKDAQFFSREPDEVESDFESFKNRLKLFYLHYFVNDSDINNLSVEQMPF